MSPHVRGNAITTRYSARGSPIRRYSGREHLIRGYSAPTARGTPGHGRRARQRTTPGRFGVHKFILGYTKEGIIQIVITLVTCGFGSLVGLIEGIIYLTKSDEEFVATYVEGRKGWF